MTDLLILKLALLADWQFLCHDDFDEEEDMDEDQYWKYLNERTEDELRAMEKDDFDDGRNPQKVLDLYMTYLSHKYQDMLPASSHK